MTEKTRLWRRSFGRHCLPPPISPGTPLDPHLPGTRKSGLGSLSVVLHLFLLWTADQISLLNSESHRNGGIGMMRMETYGAPDTTDADLVEGPGPVADDAADVVVVLGGGDVMGLGVGQGVAGELDGGGAGHGGGGEGDDGESVELHVGGWLVGWLVGWLEVVRRLCEGSVLKRVCGGGLRVEKLERVCVSE